MDRVSEAITFSEFEGKKRIALERFYRTMSSRLNFILDRIIEVDGETGLEIVKPGNEPGDNGNFFLTVNSDGDFVFKIKESGTWVRRGMKVKGS